MIAEAIHTLAAIPTVSEAVEEARDACTDLRWHNALRKRMAECRAETMVRAARCSTALEGAKFPLNYVREVVGAGREVTEDWVGNQVTAGVRVAALADEISRSSEGLRTGFRHTLAQLSVAAGAGLAAETALGRPRKTGEIPGDLGGLPVAPDVEEMNHRLEVVEQVLADPTLPGLVVAGVVHGEILALRPFVIGNGLIARALFRIHLVTSGVDPTGVSVPEAAWLHDAASYGQAGAAYTSGRDVAGWLVSCARAVTRGVKEGVQVCQSVQAGRIPK